MAISPSLKDNPNLDQWIAIAADGTVRVRSGKVDLGQRISTALAVIAGEELNIDPARIVIESPDTRNDPDEGMTTGSNSMQHSGNALRCAAATAKRVLLDKAAAHFETGVDQLTFDDGLIGVAGTNRSISLGELAGGEPFGVPVDPDAAVKAPADYRWIGQAFEPRNMRGAVTGGFEFIHDVVMPDMLHARPVRPPHRNARLKALDGAVVERLEGEGVTVVRDGSFLAVAGEDEYAVVQAAGRLARAADWDDGGGLPVGDLFEQMTANERISRPVVGGMPQSEDPAPMAPPPAGAATTLNARYEKPYLMHGTIGPSAAIALQKPDGMEIWTHSQGIQPLRASGAEGLGIDPETLLVHHHPGAGCYGHNGADDAAFDAALVARAIPGRPVLLKWTRDDEHAWEPYSSAMVVEIRASLDADGNLMDWNQDAYSDTHLGRPRPTPGGDGPARLLAANHMADPAGPFVPQPSMRQEAGLHRNIDPYYRIPERRLTKNLVRGLPLRTSAMRCLGGFANIFAMESFIDELAHAAGADPVAFRLKHLDDPRAHAVIEAAAKAIDWDAARADGVGRGIAFSRYVNAKTYTAVAVELMVDEAAEIQLRRAIVAADSGEVVDRAGLIAQLEGGFLQGASWSLYEQVLYDRDGVTSRDWETYPILKFSAAPPVKTILIDRPGEPFMGAGEASSEPAAAAIANALYDAMGVRARRLPLNPDNLRAAAMADAG